MKQDFKYMVCTRCFTYNHAPYIVDAMNGFTMQQTTFPYVCIIIDDASTDGEPDIIRQYFSENFQAPYREEETEYAHIICARHKSNENCDFVLLLLKYNHFRINKSKFPYLSEWFAKSKYLSTCEGDDRWIDPNKLHKQFVLLESNCNCNICTHNALVVMPDGRERRFTNLPEDKIFSITRVMLMRWFTPTASFFYRNNVEVPSTYAEMGANGDMGLLYTNLLKGKLYYSSDVMSVYNYATPGSLSSKTPKKVLYQKKIYLFRAINKVTNYRYVYLTLPLILYYNLKRLALRK